MSESQVTNLTHVDPNLSDISPSRMSTPFRNDWSSIETIASVSADSANHLIAQGWKLTFVTPNYTTVPPTYLYTLARKSANNWNIMYDMMSSVTDAYNEGREANQARYEDIVNMMDETINKSQSHLDTMATNANNHATFYISELDTLIAEIESDLDDVKSSADDSYQAIETQLSTYLTKTASLESGYAGHLSLMNSIFEAQEDAYSSFYSACLGQINTAITRCATESGSVRSIIGDMSTALSSYRSDYPDKLDEMETAYDTHKKDMDAAILQQATYLGTFLEDYITANDSISTNQTAHQTGAAGIESILSDKVGYLATLIEDYNTALGVIVQTHADHLTAVEGYVKDVGTNLSSHLRAYEDQIDEFEDDYGDLETAINLIYSNATNTLNAHDTSIGTLLNSVLTDYESLDASINTLLDTSDTQLTVRNNGYDTIFANLVEEYSTHSTTSTGYLTGLGTTELARINEVYDNQLAKRKQDLVDRGMYSSTLFSPIETQIERERDERIAALNDQLNRERLENEHKLYGQQTDLRGKQLQAADSKMQVQTDLLRYRATTLSQLFEQLQSVRDRTINVKTQVYNLKQAVYNFQVEVKGNMASRLQDARNLYKDGLDHIYQLRDANSRLLVEVEERLYAEVLDVKTRLSDQVEKKYAAQQEASQNQIDNKNTIYSQLLESVLRTMEGIEKQHSVSQDVEQRKAAIRDSLISQLVTVIGTVADGIHQKHAASQETHRARASAYDGILARYQHVTDMALEYLQAPQSVKQSIQELKLKHRDGLYDHVQGDIQTILDSQQKYSELKMQNAQSLVELNSKLISQKLEITMKKLDAERGIFEGHQELMATSLDTRNNLVLALLTSVEARTDSYPDISQLSDLAKSLGDSTSGNWISP